ncbi:MAG: sugar ABC transporter substrate-binding protein [Acidimicrobiales bacterium]
MKRRLLSGVLAAAALVGGVVITTTSSVAVSAAGTRAPASADSDVTIEVVTHGQASDPFWSVFKRGVDDAAARLGVTVSYSAPATFDMVEMASLIDGAVAKNPDGLVVSVPDFGALQSSLAAAADAGIPIITVNSGSDHYQEIGAITHIGQDELISGRAAGARLAEEGVTHLLCINHEVGNAALDARCAGAQEGIEEAGGTLEIVQVDLNDAAGVQSTVSATLQANADIDGILALGPTASTPAMAALDELGMTGQIPIATFDLSPDMIQAIIDGDMLFAIDQQQYLQGYLPIVFLTLHSDNLSTVGGGQPVLTGPGFVTADNAEEVLELTGEGTR